MIQASTRATLHISRAQSHRNTWLFGVLCAKNHRIRILRLLKCEFVVNFTVISALCWSLTEPWTSSHGEWSMDMWPLAVQLPKYIQSPLNVMVKSFLFFDGVGVFCVLHICIQCWNMLSAHVYPTFWKDFAVCVLNIDVAAKAKRQKISILKGENEMDTQTTNNGLWKHQSYYVDSFGLLCPVSLDVLSSLFCNQMIFFNELHVLFH